MYRAHRPRGRVVLWKSAFSNAWMSLRKAGDDLQRRKKVMQRSSSFKGLSKEWKALAMVLCREGRG